jgi:hypothetical protein
LFPLARPFSPETPFPPLATELTIDLVASPVTVPKAYPRIPSPPTLEANILPSCPATAPAASLPIQFLMEAKSLLVPPLTELLAPKLLNC